MTNMKWISTIAVMLALQGCQSLWPNYVRPQVNVPAKFSEAENGAGFDTRLQNDWWQLYQDPVLNGLVTQALKNNTNIQMAVARIEEADAAAREVSSFLLPQVDLSLAGNRTRVTESGANPVLSSNPRNSFKGQLGTSFEIDFWGKFRKAKDSARAQALASVYAKDTVSLSLASFVVTNYLDLRSLDTQITISQDSLKTRQASLALTKRRLEGGVASGLDVLQAEVAKESISAQLADLQRLRALSLHQLAVLTGTLDLKIASANINTLPLPPVPPAGLPSNLLEMRPDIRQAEETMIAADANIGVAKAALYPSISLTAGFGGESLALSDVLKSASRIWTGGLSLNLPIFDSGRLQSKVAQASAKQKQALAGYEGAIQTAFREVNDALVNLRQQAEREEALSRSESFAKKAMQLSENRYQSGYSGYLEVLDAQRVYNETALLLTQTRQARLVASVSLFKALGGGWKSDLAIQ